MAPKPTMTVTRTTTLALLLLVVALVAVSNQAEAALHEYRDVVLPRDTLMYRRSGMFSPTDTPEDKGEPSFIKLDLTFERTTPEYHGETVALQVAVFDETVWNTKLGAIVKTPEGVEERVYCCTKELIKQGACEQEATLILREDVEAGTYIHDVVFSPLPNDDKSTGPVRMSRKFPIPTTGMKVVLFAACNELVGQVKINGFSEWRNPYGYLPGELFGLLPFFSKMALVYLVVALVWALASLRNWRELMLLQTFATIVLGFGMMEMAVRYFDFATFNREGMRATALMVLSSLFHTMKQTVSRVLVLVISMGFGVIKPDLEDSTKRAVVGLGVAFFFFAALQRLYELLSHTSPLSFAQYFTMLPVAALDLVFGVWIFFSLNHVINFLADKEGNVHKLQLFKSFRVVLGITVLVAFVWSLAYVFIVVSGRVSTEWKTRWVYDAIFDILYLAVLIAILFLFRPLSNSSSFAFSYAQVPAALRVGGGNRSGARVANAANAEEYGEGLQEEEVELVKNPNNLEAAKAVDKSASAV